LPKYEDAAWLAIRLQAQIDSTLVKTSLCKLLDWDSSFSVYADKQDRPSHLAIARWTFERSEVEGLFVERQVKAQNSRTET